MFVHGTNSIFVSVKQSLRDFKFAGLLRALIVPTVTSTLGVILTEETEKQTYIQK